MNIATATLEQRGFSQKGFGEVKGVRGVNGVGGGYWVRLVVTVDG